MDLRAFVLLMASASINALLTLTVCPTAGDFRVPCLRDANNVTSVLVDQPFHESFDLSGLDISTVEALPPNATYIDLSNNKISQLDCEMPSSLSFLNLSHNTLSRFPLSVPLPVSTLDVSNSQGGLSWLQDATWSFWFPRIQNLIARGNNLDTLWLDRINFPSSGSCSIWQIDVLDNPDLTIKMGLDVYTFVNRCVVKIHFDCDYNKTLSACDGNAEDVKRLLRPSARLNIENATWRQDEEIESPTEEYICMPRQFAPAAMKPDIMMPSIVVTEETAGMSKTAKYALLMGGVFGFFIIVYIIAGCVYKHKETQEHYRRQASACISKAGQGDGAKSTGGSSLPLATLRFA
ncbi:unnamed protein product [Aphanomyces euteiches]|uniref:Leucine-rich repeat-containing N-terminal plant-type domain-containing protein n=1 Tax=Aphanomyces euteiches TaxID=100861 RepID=A0A6G0XUN2_9STRA|nr:hypothetical protein Ae201684_001286 [Aphanomyces euteiches]KAH9099413.1 hypothetical protein Ae201684P_018429 [Aphanomyces euteiches]